MVVTRSQSNPKLWVHTYSSVKNLLRCNVFQFNYGTYENDSEHTGYTYFKLLQKIKKLCSDINLILSGSRRFL